MAPLLTYAFAILALAWSLLATAGLSEEQCDETSLVQSMQTVKLAAGRSEWMKRSVAQSIRRSWLRDFGSRKPPEKESRHEATPKQSKDKHNDEFVETLAATKMEYKRRLIEHEVAGKEMLREKAAAETKLADAKTELEKIVARGRDVVNNTEAKADAAREKWRAMVTKMAGLDDLGTIKETAEKQAETDLEQQLAAEWEVEYGKATAKRTASEMAARQRATAEDYFADMADVQKLTTDLTADVDDSQADDFSEKVAQRTAAEKAAVAKVTQQNYESDTAITQEVEAVEKKVNAQLDGEEASIMKEAHSEPSESSGKDAVKQVHNSSKPEKEIEKIVKNMSASEKAFNLAGLMRGVSEIEEGDDNDKD